MNVGVRMNQRRSGPIDGGFSLLEVLIAILVLSFGMLAMVGLQAGALHSNREARLQSSAVRYGRELAELMRGNKTIANMPVDTDNPYLVGNFQGAAPAINPLGGCMAASCDTPKLVATLQMSDWLSRVATELPGTRVVVCFDNAPYDNLGLPKWGCSGPASGTMAIKIGWTQQSLDRGAAGTAGAASLTPGLEQATLPSIILQVVPGT